MRDDELEDAEPEPGDSDATEICPRCERLIYEDAPRCPYCGCYVSAGEVGGERPWWMVIALILAALATAAFLVNWIMASLPPRP